MPLKLYLRGEIWHYRGTIAKRRLRGSTGSSSKEEALDYVAEKEASLGRGVPLADILEALEKRKRQRNLAVKTLQVCVSLTRTTHERVSSSGTRLTQRNPSLFHPVRER